MKSSPEILESPKEADQAFYHLNGSSFGPIPRNHIARLWLTGSIPDDTLVFLTGSSTWEPLTKVFPGLSKLKNPGPSQPLSLPPDRISKEIREKPVFRRAEASPGSGDDDSSSHPLHANLWQKAFIVSLLVGTAAIGAIFFSFSGTFSEIESLRSRTKNLQNLVREKDTVIQRLRDSTRSRLEPNEIQGRLILQSAEPKAGAKVALFRRSEMEKFLKDTLSKKQPDADENSVALDILENLPFPIASTATDSEGFYHLEIPEPGEFVLHSNIVGTHSKILVWFLSFSPDDPDHSPIHFTEKNTSNLISPDLSILKAR